MRLPLFLIAAGFATLVQAHTVFETDLVCPIGGQTFKAVLAGSGTSFGKFLDLKPYGPIAAPWPLAKCPDNGFVIFKETFTDAELERLTAFVASPAYREMKDVHSPYYLAAALQQEIGAAPERVAFTLLQATWEAGDERYHSYAAAALDAYVRLLDAAPGDDRQRLTHRLIAGELERRLGHFDAAARRFQALQDEATLPPFIRSVIALQQKLIAARNASQQPMPRGQ